MDSCQICTRIFKKLRFHTAEIRICARCVSSFEKSPEPAAQAVQRLEDSLRRAMWRKTLEDLHSEDPGKASKGRYKQANFDAVVAKTLGWWLNKLLADKNNTTKDFKILRAHRRGLLRMNGGVPFVYKSNWPEQASKTRLRDGLKCMDCGASGMALDVHHIIHLSKFGTNQTSNLVTLCRSCHQAVHGRIFDFEEVQLEAQKEGVVDAHQPLAAPSVEQKPAPILTSTLDIPPPLGVLQNKGPQTHGGVSVEEWFLIIAFFFGVLMVWAAS